MSDGYIIDASVGIKLFIFEPHADTVSQLFSHNTGRQPSLLHVPDLFYIECTNILWKYVRNFSYPALRAQESTQELQTLSVQATPSVQLIDSTLKIALELQISAYDACYLALSKLLGLPLVTADMKLLNKIIGTRYQYRTLDQIAAEMK